MGNWGSCRRLNALPLIKMYAREIYYNLVLCLINHAIKIIKPKMWIPQSVSELRQHLKTKDQMIGLTATARRCVGDEVKATTLCVRCVVKYMYIGPILDMLKEKILKPWKGVLSIHFRVCLSVCISVRKRATGNSFLPRNLILGLSDLWDMCFSKSLFLRFL